MNRIVAIAISIFVVGGLVAGSAAPGDWQAWLRTQPDARAEPSRRRSEVRQQLAALRSRRSEPTPTPGRRSLQDGEGRPWRLSLRRDPSDGRLVGRVIVPNGDGIVEGRVEGSEQGSQVAGSVFGVSGSLLATFSGTRTDGRLSGTYRTAQGESGEWGE